MTKLITKIKNKMVYKRNLKFLKMYTVNTITGFILNKADMVNAIQKIILAVNDTENSEEIKELLTNLIIVISEKDKTNKLN